MDPRLPAAVRRPARAPDTDTAFSDTHARKLAMTRARSLAQPLLTTRPMSADLHASLPHLPPVRYDRPRERVWHRGVTNVGDEELIALVLGTGVRKHSAREVAAELVRTVGGLAALSHASPREMSLVTGIGTARATRIAAVFELGRRAIASSQHRDALSRPEDVFRVVESQLAGLAQEVFLVLGVDIRNGLLDVVEVARGSVNGVEVHPREVFRPLVRMAAAGGVVVHNHPSGDPTPSTEDVALTRRLRGVGELIGIPIIDHVVIGGGRFRSIAEWLGTEL